LSKPYGRGIMESPVDEVRNTDVIRIDRICSNSREAVYRTAKRLLLEKGIDMSGQRSRPLILAMFQDADLVLAMKIWHKPRRQWLAPFALGGFTLLTPGKGIKFPTRIMNQR